MCGAKPRGGRARGEMRNITQVHDRRRHPFSVRGHGSSKAGEMVQRGTERRLKECLHRQRFTVSPPSKGGDDGGALASLSDAKDQESPE